MENDIITSWSCWYIVNNNIHTAHSTTHTINDIPPIGVHALRLWFAKKHTSRFVSGDKYIIFKAEDIINKSSSYVIQDDILQQEYKDYIIKESSDIDADLEEEIFNLLLNSTDPTL